MHLVLHVDGVVRPYIHMYTWVPRHRCGVAWPYIRMYIIMCWIFVEQNAFGSAHKIAVSCPN